MGISDVSRKALLHKLKGKNGEVTRDMGSEKWVVIWDD